MDILATRAARHNYAQLRTVAYSSVAAKEDVACMTAQATDVRALLADGN